MAGIDRPMAPRTHAAEASHLMQRAKSCDDQDVGNPGYLSWLAQGHALTALALAATDHEGLKGIQIGIVT